ncbi:hypothetical protein [Porphyromonas pogonae]|uniref:hypothetical protein n=1 Tax=Porphyromonas pogonae TaxID=867595 RepID=UPI002E7A721B|nr:hypothetical protein [Porphyromonas pogonae]
MKNKLFVVKYSGPLGFIKPWTAVRDSETFSQQFLTPSIIEGIEKKLFPELLQESGIKNIKRYRLNYCGIDIQQERTWAKGGFSFTKEKGEYKTNLGIIKRGIMIDPNLYLAFNTLENAEKALKQTICLCRNEDLLYPEYLQEMEQDEFELIQGFELTWDYPSERDFKVGHNRFHNACEMFGELKIVGNPIRSYDKIS